MAAVITDVSQATPEWLTERLRAAGLLAGGRIETASVAGHARTNVSAVYHLALTYSGAQSPSAPGRLFLKIPELTDVWADRETVFYARLAPPMQAAIAAAGLPFIPCIDAAYDHSAGRSHLLLVDLSTSHAAATAATPPSASAARLAVSSFARLHAFWWQHPQLDRLVGPLLAQDRLAEMLATAQARLDSLRASAGDRLAAEDLRILARVAAAWPERRKERLLRGLGVTLVHRDPHPGNLLYPRDPVHGHAYLIDWQSWRVDTGTDDLAYWMAFHWPTTQRRGMEMPLLRAYHAALSSFGVSDYGWDDCRYDYRASVIRCLFFTLAAYRPGPAGPPGWWPRIELGLGAFRDLACDELLPAG